MFLLRRPFKCSFSRAVLRRHSAPEHENENERGCRWKSSNLVAFDAVVEAPTPRPRTEALTATVSVRATAVIERRGIFGDDARRRRAARLESRALAREKALLTAAAQMRHRIVGPIALCVDQALAFRVADRGLLQIAVVEEANAFSTHSERQ
jgi:hypothetical protein